MTFFVLEKILNFYHCHDKETCDIHAFSMTVILGDAFHNFLDGIAIALSFLISIPTGIATTAAVFFHEVPQEIGDFSILVRGGLSTRRALFYNFVVALAVVLGAILTYVFGTSLEPFLPFLLAIVAGNFLYIAAVDLMPELHEVTRLSHTVLQIVLLIAGALLVMIPDFLLR
jgi:zinc and cadmium transporter